MPCCKLLSQAQTVTFQPCDGLLPQKGVLSAPLLYICNINYQQTLREILGPNGTGRLVSTLPGYGNTHSTLLVRMVYTT